MSYREMEPDLGTQSGQQRLLMEAMLAEIKNMMKKELEGIHQRINLSPR